MILDLLRKISLVWARLWSAALSRNNAMSACVGLRKRPQGAGANDNEGPAAAGYSAPNSLLINPPNTFPKRIQRGSRQQAVNRPPTTERSRQDPWEDPLFLQSFRAELIAVRVPQTLLSAHSAVKPHLLSLPIISPGHLSSSTGLLMPGFSFFF